MNRCEEVLEHHGILGMKWGVRRYQNKDGSLTAAGKARLDKTESKINKLYDWSNKRSRKKIAKLEKKGKKAKADVQRQMIKYNEAARKRNIQTLRSMNAKEYNKARRRGRLDWLLGYTNMRDASSKMMNTKLSRLNEATTQIGMRWASNFTLNSTLAQMTPEEGMRYLRNKNLASRSTQYVVVQHSDTDE